MSEKIRSLVQRRGITSLAHFTRLKNVPGILRLGLLPRAFLQTVGVEFAQTDDDRRDPHWSFTCLSVNLPNPIMLRRKLLDHPDEAWVVLMFEPLPLLEHSSTRFCPVNLSTTGASDMIDEGLGGLEGLFEGKWLWPGKSSARPRMDLPSDPQAEVLLQVGVPASALKEVACRDAASMVEAVGLLADAGSSARATLRPDLFETPNF
jgi:hypothetical protein